MTTLSLHKPKRINLYRSGVRIEREVVLLFKEVGWRSSRQAGSHGLIDLSAFQDEGSSAKTLANVFNSSLAQSLGWSNIAIWTRDFPPFDRYYQKLTSRIRARAYVMLGSTGDPNHHLIALIQCKKENR